MGVDLQSLRDRVKASGLFRAVGDMAALGDIMLNPGNIGEGTAYVVAPSEQAEPNKLLGGTHRQRIRLVISVVFVVKAQRIGDIKTDKVEAIRSTLRGHLMGWTPAGAGSPLDYVSSAIRSVDGAFILTEMLFATSYLDQAAA